MAPENSINVLYVDDERENLQAFTATFRRYFTVFTAISAKDAEVILEENDIHILITDQRMPVKMGTELLIDAVKKYPNQIRILLTAYADVDCLEAAINLGQIYKYLKKPWNDVELKQAIENGYSIFRLQREKNKLLEELERRTEEVNAILKKKGKD